MAGDQCKSAGFQPAFSDFKAARLAALRPGAYNSSLRSYSPTTLFALTMKLTMKPSATSAALMPALSSLPSLRTGGQWGL